jgi:hypothetical protein
MVTIFTDFFKKFPLEFSEMVVVKSIHKTLECAEKELKEDKESTEHIKYMAKAYFMLEEYFREKGVNPAQHV